MAESDLERDSVANRERKGREKVRQRQSKSVERQR